MKKITVATVKSFIRKNESKILINVKSKFDGMTDGIESRKADFRKLVKNEKLGAKECNLGFDGVWFVGGNRDYCTAFEQGGLKGFEVSNCCGKWIVAVQA